MHATADLSRGRPRTRLLSALLLLIAAIVGIGVVSQTPASASVTFSTFAGTGTAGTSGDGGAATSAQLYQPQGLSTDSAGNVYIVDARTGIPDIRKVDTGGTITTLDNSSHGFCDSSSYSSSAMTFDSGLGFSSWLSQPFNGSAYINNCHWLNEVWTDGSQAHAAGISYWNSSTPVDGSTFSVRVDPASLAVDTSGVSYFAEPEAPNSIKVWTGGSVTSEAGQSSNNTCSTAASGGQTALGACLHPSWLTYSAYNNSLYFFDSMSGGRGPEIFRIDLSAGSPTLQLVAGDGSWSDSGIDGSTATSDGISNTGPMAIDSAGNLFFGSVTTGALREVDTSGNMWNVGNFGVTTYAFAFDSANTLYAAEPGAQKVVQVTGLDPVTSKGNLVALGDSVAAGEGINYGFSWNGSKWIQGGPGSPSWTNTTATLGADYQGCHQSDYAYSRLLQSNGYTVYNMACTGASVLQNTGIENGGILDNEVLGGGTSPPAQLGGTCTGCDSANTVFDGHNPTVVTLTVGANDLNFGDWVGQCYGGTSACGNSTDVSLLNSQLAIEKSDLRTALTELNRRAGLDLPSGQTLRVLVTNYYDPLPAATVSCNDTAATLLQPTYPWIGITSGENTFLQNGLIDLNGNINTEVNYAITNDANLNVSLVDISNIMSGHQWCSSDPWAYGPSIDYPAIGGGPLTNPSPFHPTLSGQNAIYQAVLTQGGL